MLVSKIVPVTHIFLHEAMIRGWLSKKVEILLSLFHKHRKDKSPTSKLNAVSQHSRTSSFIHEFSTDLQALSIARHSIE